MEKGVMFDFNKSPRLHRGNQHFFINEEEVSGVQQVSANFSLPIAQLEYMGMRSSPIEYAPDGGFKGEVSLGANLISKDFFIDLTGYSGFNGYILKNKSNSTENFSFTSGYLTSYSHKASIGKAPTVDATVSVLGKMGRIPTGESPKVTTDLENIQNYYPKYGSNIIAPGSIEIEGEGFEDFKSNRVNQYSIEISTERNPIYVLGHRYPTQVELNYPVEVTCKFSLESNDIVPYTNSDYPCAPKNGDLTIKLRDKDSNAVAHQYHFTNLILHSQSFSTSANGNQTLDLSYKTYINRP
jgi:hypothetical protein